MAGTRSTAGVPNHQQERNTRAIITALLSPFKNTERIGAYHDILGE